MFSSQVTRSQRWGVTTSLCSVNPHSRIHNQHDVNFEGHTATWIHIIGSDILLLYGSDENFDSIDWHRKKFPGFFWLTSLFQCLLFKGILQIKGWNFWSHEVKDIENQEKKTLSPLSIFYLELRGRLSLLKLSLLRPTSQRTMWDIR